MPLETAWTNRTIIDLTEWTGTSMMEMFQAVMAWTEMVWTELASTKMTPAAMALATMMWAEASWTGRAWGHWRPERKWRG